MKYKGTFCTLLIVILSTIVSSTGKRQSSKSLNSFAREEQKRYISIVADSHSDVKGTAGIGAKITNLWQRVLRNSPEHSHHHRPSFDATAAVPAPSQSSSSSASAPTEQKLQLTDTELNVAIAAMSLRRRFIWKCLDGFASLFFLSLSWWVTLRAVGQIITGISRGFNATFQDDTLSAPPDGDGSSLSSISGSGSSNTGGRTGGLPWSAGRGGTGAELPFTTLLFLHNNVQHSSMRNASILLTSHEADLIGAVTAPQQIETSISDLGGMEQLKLKIMSAVMPLILSDAAGYWKEGNVFKPARSALLYGPPGCGEHTLLISLLLSTAVMKTSHHGSCSLLDCLFHCCCYCFCYCYYYCYYCCC